MKFLFIFLYLVSLNIFARPSIGLNGNVNSIEKSDIDMEMAKKWFEHYYNEGKERFELAFARGDKYKKSIELVLAKYEIPIDFYYLAMTESYFENEAKSNVGALGIWQFMAGTAKNYGLEVNEKIDERLHPVKSTIAAAKYLKDLYNIFQSWTLAAAAYNCGEYRVLAAIKKAGSRSFPVLSNKKLLPSETINYISKIWVTREIDNRLREATKNIFDDLYIDTHPLKINSSEISLNTLSLILELGVEDIKKLNPDILKNEDVQLGEKTLYLPKENANLYYEFIQNNGVVSRVKTPKTLKGWGLGDSKLGDSIKITFLNNEKIKIRNIRTKNEVIVDRKDLIKI